MSGWSRPLFFCHVTKTAGKSVESAIGKHFKTFTFDHDTDYTTLSDYYEAYVGQVGWYVGNLLPSKTFRFTFVRDPIDRLLSFYDFYQAYGIQRVRFLGQFMDLKMWPIPESASVEEFLSHPAIRTIAWNRMTRDIGSQGCVLEQANKDTLRHALEIADTQMNFCGVFERFERSMNRLSEILGVELPIEHINKLSRDKTKFESLNRHEKELVEDYTYMDRDFYNHVTFGSLAYY